MPALTTELDMTVCARRRRTVIAEPSERGTERQIRANAEQAHETEEAAEEAYVGLRGPGSMAWREGHIYTGPRPDPQPAVVPRDQGDDGRRRRGLR